MNNDFEKQYYEDDFNWDNLKVNRWIREKISVIKSIIPENVKTIADVGCGNGIIINSFGDRYNVIGVDRSKTALTEVSGLKVNGDIINLPLKSYCSDLVISSEVLEHLPGENLFKAIDELKRISRKYILITVPNGEYLKKNYIECSNCHHEFNASMHLNSFTESKLRNHFSEYDVVMTFTCGKPVRQYIPILLKVRQKLGKSWGRFTQERRFMCPECGVRFIPTRNVNVISRLCDGINHIFTTARPYWLGILFTKKS
ncbi:MAG: class I SAM-dependent methyltransferase [candidate division KSB1 bacterium]|jgi:SAM-dependent methyltransferase|nr:class I SAM-dependent methyltransferase [candidate division KSB1 bacterium]